MPKLRRPDGVEIHWQEQGEGPLVVFANTFMNYPGVFSGLVEELARDHRVVEYDLRGNGESTRAGPYDMDTDAEDLIALVEELGPPALALATGDGCMRAVKAAAARPGLFEAVVSPAGSPLGRKQFRGESGLMTSDEVVEGILRMTSVDYRAALRSILTSVNSQAGDDEIRERVERTIAYCPQESGVARGSVWLDSDATEEARQLGRRLWILESGTNPWFGSSITFDRTPVVLPEAQVLPAEDGVISRPDITAGVVRRLTAQARERSGAHRP